MYKSMYSYIFACIIYAYRSAGVSSASEKSKKGKGENKVHYSIEYYSSSLILLVFVQYLLCTVDEIFVVLESIGILGF